MKITKNGASSGKLNQIAPKLSLPDDNEYILTLIGDINALRREIEQIRNDQTMCNGLKLMDRIAEENIRLNKEVKLLKELYNVQGQKQGKKQL